MALKDHILKLADGVSKCQENAKSLAQVIFRGLDDIADNLPEHPGGGSDVSVTQVLSSGTKTATITVDDVDTDLYAPDPTDVVVTQEQTSGTKIATITVDDTPTDLYAPTPAQPTDVDVTQVISTGTKIATITVDDVPTDIYAPNASGHIYSTTEQVVGKWVDGRDIYEITFETSNSTINASVNIDVSALNIDFIISYGGCTDRIVPNVGVIIWPWNFYESADYQTALRHEKFANRLVYTITMPNNESNSFQKIVIQYVKTVS